MKCSGATLGLLFMLLTLNAFSQEVFKTRASPLALATARYKDAYIKITYSQPQKHGREIFGKLVPYGAVWRTGANEATEITLTSDIFINHQLLKAGTYSIFTIPEKDKWTIIINGGVGLWGDYNYNPKLDVMRFEVPTAINDVIFEGFTLSFNQNNEMADLLMQWDNITISIPVQFIN